MSLLAQIKDNINPTSYEAHYHHVFAFFLNGFWCRFFAISLLLLSLWSAFQRRNVVASAGFFALMLVFAYGAPILSLFGLM